MSTLKATNIQNASSATVNMVNDTLGNTAFGGMPYGASSFLRNRIINGNMAVDQRNAGATQTFTAAAALAYSVDRWYGYCTGANVTGARVTGASANQYRYQFTGAASVTAIGFGQRIEAINCADFAGSTVTISVDLANTLLTSVAWALSYANTADTFGSLASPTVTAISNGSFSVTSAVTRYSVSVAIPAAATTGLQLVLTAGAQISGTWTIGNVQLEPGTVATPFERQIYNAQLAQCQRYYYRITPAGTLRILGNGYVTSATVADFTAPFPVTMRDEPAALEQIGTAANYTVVAGAGGVACSSVPTYLQCSQWGAQYRFTVAAGLTTGQSVLARNAVTGSYLGWSAEL